MCALALSRGVLATRGLSWPCDVDLYRDIGFARSMLDGFPFADPLYRGESLWYPPLVPALIALATWVSGAPLNEVATHLGVYLNMLAPVGFYLLCARLLGRRAGAAAVAAFLFIAPGAYPSWAAGTYSPWLFPGNFVQGLFYLGLAALHRAATSKLWRWWAGTGALLGLCALGHAAPALLLGAVAVLVTVQRLVRPGDAGRAPAAAQLLVLLAVAFVVALPLVSSVLLHYGLEVKNAAPSSWTYLRLELRNLPRLWDDLLAPSLALPLIGYFGVVLAARPRPWTRPVLLYWFGSAAALLVHAYLQQWLESEGVQAPVVAPAHHFHLYLKALESVFIGCALALAARGVSALAGRAAGRLGRGGGPDSARDVAALLGTLTLTIALAWPIYRHRDDFTGAPQKASILTPDADLARTYRWIVDNTPPDAVFLAGDHLSLHVVSPAGRKVVAMIPFFSNPFVPWKERHRHRAEMFPALHRGDGESFGPLAQKYGVSYLLERGGVAVKLYASSAHLLRVAHRAGEVWVLQVK